MKKKTKNPGTIMFFTSHDGKKASIFYPDGESHVIPRDAVDYRIATAHLQGKDVCEVDDLGEILHVFKAPIIGESLPVLSGSPTEVIPEDTEDLLEGIDMEEDLLAGLKDISSDNVSDLF